METPSFRDKGIQFLQAAVDEDRKHNFEEAFGLYQRGIEHLMVAKKYEKQSNVVKILEEKIREHLQRAEELKQYLGKGGAYLPHAKAAAPGDPNKVAKKRKDVSPMDETLRESIQTTILSERPNVKWSDIAGLEQAKDALKEAVVLPLKAPHLFMERLEPWKGILMYGPPGTGKTQLAKAVATECKSTFFSVSSADLVSKYVGESERLVKQLFELARESSPSVIFLDEIESLCGQRKESDNETSSRIKTEFLQQMQGVGNPMDGVLVLAATNLPWELDSAILRRFQRRVHIPLPEEEARVKMIEIHLQNVPNSLSQEDRRLLASQLEGFSGSDIKEVSKDARYEAARNLKYCTHVMKNGSRFLPCSPSTPGAVEMTFDHMDENNLLQHLDLPPVSMSDFQKAVRRSRPMTKPEDIKKCEEWTRLFGLQGV